MASGTSTGRTNTAPHLTRFMLLVTRETETALDIIESYCVVLENRLFYDLAHLNQIPPPPGVDTSEFEHSADDEWATLNADLLQHSPVSRRSDLPTFEAIWTEARTVLHSFFGRQPIAEDLHYIQQRLDHHGLMVGPLIILTYETLRSSPELQDWIDYLMDMQPRYNDLPSDVANQSRARQLSGSDTLPDLAQAIGNFSHDADAIKLFIGCFGDFVQTATRLFFSLGTGGAVTEARLNESLDCAVEEHRGLISFPFSWPLLRHRRQLAKVNVRGTLMLLITDALALAMSESGRTTLNHVYLCMFKKFANGIMQVANTHNPQCMSIIRQALTHYDLDHFLEPNSHASSLWIWDAHVVGDESDDEVDPDDLPDVCFEPKGPARRVEHYAKAVTTASEISDEPCSICYETLNACDRLRDYVAVKVQCGHCFHYGCLDTLINGISKFSNLCPNCRQEICPRRNKRLKEAADLDNAEATDIEATDRLGHDWDLQDRQGDVIMTDD